MLSLIEAFLGFSRLVSLTSPLADALRKFSRARRNKKKLFHPAGDSLALPFVSRVNPIRNPS